MKDTHGITTVDYLTCNLNDPFFQEQISQMETDLGLDIRYSVDQTGNNPDGNWVLESDNVNVKDVYFTSAIDSWTGVLNSAISGSNIASIDGISSSVVGGKTIYSLD